MSDQEKVRFRADGSVVLFCESGNPALGVMATPCHLTGSDEKGLIVSIPEDEGVFSCVNVTLGPEQCAVLRDLAAKAAV